MNILDQYGKPVAHGTSKCLKVRMDLAMDVVRRELAAELFRSTTRPVDTNRTTAPIQENFVWR